MISYKLRGYQQEAMDALWGFLVHDTGSGVIESPTGSGKSLLIAETARGVHQAGRRMLCLAHRKELLRQNGAKTQSLAPEASIGYFSSGMRQWDTESDIIFAGIQSVYNKAFDLGPIDLVLIDEAHLESDKEGGMFTRFFEDMRTGNPDFRKVGLTASPYRLGSGLIYGPGRQFDKLIYKIKVADLIEQGHLCPVTTQPVKQIDTSKLNLRGGEFIESQMSSLFEQHVVEACSELVEVVEACEKKHVLVFTCGVSHAEQVAECLRTMTGEDVACVTGETLPIIRATSLEQFSEGHRKWLVNVDVLTTGFDAPCVDCIAIMRSTMSPGLSYQIIGRGLRLHEDKTECLICDYGGNVDRHGPIDSEKYGQMKPKTGAGGGGDMPTKICLGCEHPNPAGCRTCEKCGLNFPAVKTSHDEFADRNSAILESQIKPEHWSVVSTTVAVHKKRGAEDDDPRTLRVTYSVVPVGEDTENANLKRQWISEWVCLEHQGRVRSMAVAWWSKRSNTVPPDTIEEAVDLFRQGALAPTLEITTMKKDKFQQVKKHVLGDIPEGEFYFGESDDEDPFGEQPEYPIQGATAWADDDDDVPF